MTHLKQNLRDGFLKIPKEVMINTSFKTSATSQYSKADHFAGPRKLFFNFAWSTLELSFVYLHPNGLWSPR